jgi:hypothetical protein
MQGRSFRIHNIPQREGFPRGNRMLSRRRCPRFRVHDRLQLDVEGIRLALDIGGDLFLCKGLQVGFLGQRLAGNYGDGRTRGLVPEPGD